MFNVNLIYIRIIHIHMHMHTDTLNRYILAMNFLPFVITYLLKWFHVFRIVCFHIKFMFYFLFHSNSFILFAFILFIFVSFGFQSIIIKLNCNWDSSDGICMFNWKSHSYRINLSQNCMFAKIAACSTKKNIVLVIEIVPLVHYTEMWTYA